MKIGVEVLNYVVLVCLVINSEVLAQESGFNVKTKTLGGRQFWTDVQHLDSWRIQKNHVTQNYRVVDHRNFRHAKGSLEHCRQKFAALAMANNLKPFSGKVVILLHGLSRAHPSMEPLADHLSDGGYQTLNFQYASGQVAIGEHALALQGIVDQLGDEVTEVNFVAHSLGNIVIRHYLKNARDDSDEEGDARIRRMVMIGPPNQGSQMASLLCENPLFRSVTGSSGFELGKGWAELEPKLAIPKFEFGIIAGGQTEKAKIGNPLLDGKDDLVVTVEEARLAGAHDYFISPVRHTFMMMKPSTLEMTLNFLKNGYFISEQKRRPILPRPIKN